MHTSFLYQLFLSELFKYVQLEFQTYLGELYEDEIKEFMGFKKSIELSCNLFLVSSAKSRKKIMKNIKDSIQNAALNEVSSLLLAKIILFCDDTVLVSKYILKPIMELTEENFFQSHSILKLFTCIVDPTNKHIYPIEEQRILSESTNSSSKKEQFKRSKEIYDVAIEHLIELVNKNLLDFFSTAEYGYFLTNYMASLSNFQYQDNLVTLMCSVVELGADDIIQKGSIGSSLFCSEVGYSIIKRIIKINNNNVNISQFNTALSKVLEENLMEVMETKGIFVLCELLKSNDTASIKGLMAEVKKQRSYITKCAQEDGKAGFKILDEIISK